MWKTTSLGEGVRFIVGFSLGLLGWMAASTAFANQTSTADPTPGSAITEAAETIEAVNQTFDLDNLPAGWDWELNTEPVWQSKVFVLQAGLQNQQTILLVHGIGGSVTDWLKVVPVLAQDYHVIGVDLPGFGRSAQPKGRYSPENYSQFLTWVAQQYAHTPMIVVGHSMGGAISLQYAADFPHQVQRLVLVDAAGILERTALLKLNAELPIDTGALPPMFKKFGAQVLDFGRSIVEWTGVSPDPTPIVEESDLAWNSLFQGRPGGNAAMALVMHNFSDAINQVKQDTFLIWGEEDSVAPLRTGYLLAGRLENASLAIINGAEHVPMRTHPASFEAYLLAALESSDASMDSADAGKETETAPTIKGAAECRGKHGVTFTGHYRSVSIHKCTGVILQDVTTEQLTMTSSLVDLLNVVVNNPEGVAVEGVESVITATNATFTGKTAILSRGSRWDLAGVSIHGQEQGVRLEQVSSRFVFSVSDIRTPLGTNNLHQVMSLGPGLLEDRL